MKLIAQETLSVACLVGALLVIPRLLSLQPESGRTILIFVVLWLAVRASVVAVRTVHRRRAPHVDQSS